MTKPPQEKILEHHIKNLLKQERQKVLEEVIIMVNGIISDISILYAQTIEKVNVKNGQLKALDEIVKRLKQLSEGKKE